MNPFRILLARAIRANSGYTSYNDIRCPIEYNVAVDNVNFDVEHLVKLGIEYEMIPQKGALRDRGLMRSLEGQWDEKHRGRVWDWVVEDMRNSVLDLNDTYRTIGPDTARRFGYPYERFPKKYRRRTEKDMAYYPAGKEGWVLEDPYKGVPMFDVEFGFHGRQGKHLCIERFEGHDLTRIDSYDLAEAIEHDDCGDYSNWWCRGLLAMMSEWDVCFSRAAVKREAEYQAAFRIAEDVREWYEQIKEKREVTYWRNRGVETVHGRRHA